MDKTGGSAVIRTNCAYCKTKFDLDLLYRPSRRYCSRNCKTLATGQRRAAQKPWLMNLRASRERCLNESGPGWNRYGGRGIKCFLTREQTQKLWERDKAWRLKVPTLDRIDNDGNYTIKNCQFLERAENARKRWKTN